METKSLTIFKTEIENKQIMKTKKLFLVLLLFSVFLIVGPGCKVFQHHNRSNGELISTKPHGRLAPGEIDDMSGSRNENPNAPKKDKKHRRE